MEIPLAPRTIVLTERVQGRVRLPPETADFLLNGWRHVLTLTPTRRRHHYCLTPLGYVGILSMPGARFVIRPKIPLRNVFFMIDPSVALTETPDRSEAEDVGLLLDVLAGRLARRMTDHFAAGLHRNYAERKEAGPFLRGRLDLPAQLRSTEIGQLHCVHEEFTVDIPCNQAPRATAERLLTSPLIGSAARSALLHAVTLFEGIRPIVCSGSVQAPPTYQPVLDLCQLLDDALRSGEANGPAGGPTFLLNLERVFERYVALVVAEVGGASVRIQPAMSIGGGSSLVIRPDLLIGRNGERAVVADTKWKRRTGSRADVYQVIAYATALGADRAVLIYPGRRNQRQAVKVGSVQLEQRRLDVTGSPETCRRSLVRLARWLTRSTR